MDLFQLTRQLVDIPSVTGSEGDLTQFLSNFLRDLGYHVELQELDKDRLNILATTKSSPKIVFSTHLDTVPPFIPSSEDETDIYGRGSCDAKGIIAAQIFAGQLLRAEDVNEFGFLFTVDEEISSKGAQLANRHPLAQECRFLINGEPTENKLAVGTKGAMRVLLTAEGRAAHSAYPEVGESAIEKLLDVLNDLRNVKWPEDEVFGATTCNIGVINGGTRPNVIPDKAGADLAIRLAVDIEQTKRIVENAVQGRANIEFASAHAPLKLFSVRGFEECVVRFATDIPYLSNWGKALLLGPGSILDAHTDHERVSKQELKAAVDLYANLARQLLKEKE